jgi:hypothetical protein
MDKVVPCLIPYKFIFFLKIFDQDKASFRSNQIVFSLDIRFKSKSALFSLAPARRRTPPDRRLSPLLPRSCRDAGPRSPPSSTWCRPHRTPAPLFPLRFPFPLL